VEDKRRRWATEIGYDERMTYNSLPRIGSRPMSAGTWDLTRRQRLNNEAHVRFADSGFSRPTSERDLPLYSAPASEAATIMQVPYEVCTVRGVL